MDKSLNSFYHPLGHASFDRLGWAAVTASLTLGYIPSPTKGSAVFLSIDDAMVEKCGRKFQARSKLFGHTAHKGSNYLDGCCFVRTMIHVPVEYADGALYLSVPLGCRLWTKELSKLEPAADMVRSAMPEPVSCGRAILLCDSWRTRRSRGLYQSLETWKELAAVITNL